MSIKSVLGIGVIIVVVIASGIYFNKDILPDWVVLPSEYQDTFECAENGDPICQREIAELFLGFDYRSGIAKASNILAPFRAHKWFLKAALQGDKISMGNYGWFLCGDTWGDSDHILRPIDGLAWVIIAENYQLNLFKMDGTVPLDPIIFDCHKEHSIMYPNEPWEEALIKAEKRARELNQKIRRPN